MIREEECNNCKFYGGAIDAPDTVQMDCMYEILREEDDDNTPPCCKKYSK